MEVQLPRQNYFHNVFITQVCHAVRPATISSDMQLSGVTEETQLSAGGTIPERT